METLNLGSSGEPRPVSISPPAPKPKDSTLAFLLSLVVPGAGQMYCGEARRGGLTLFFFGVGAALVIGLFPLLSGPEAESLGLLWGIGLRTALVLYAFSFLDAFFTARELTAGTYELQEYNPRVAAVLNLLTRGFGYWYLDEKGKGVALFVLVGVADRAGRHIKDTTISNTVALIVEVALAAMAVHAYRLAQQKNEKWLRATPVTAAPIQPSSGLTPSIPLALAGLLAVGYVGLVAIGMLMPEDAKVDQSAATITRTEAGKSYVHAKLGFELHAPPEWELSNTDPDNVVEASYLDGVCSVTLMQGTTLPLYSAEGTGRQLVETIQSSDPGFRLLESRPAQLAGLPAHEVVLSRQTGETEVQQNYVLARRGFWLYALVITRALPLGEMCNTDIQTIRQRVVLPR
jgi:TM2 domain-containing membrane protein YozV